VPIGLGKAIGETLITCSRNRSDEARLGSFVCFNLDLLAKLTRRPKTIVNPPRMREDSEESTISGWYGDSRRMRDDAFDYVPPGMLGKLEEMAFRKKADGKPLNARTTDEEEAGSESSRGAEEAAWLAAAE
jgi:DNA (cytosine-5)-methyltransferase 1